MVVESIHHPSVTHYLNFVATTVGRDKVLRTLQYFSRFLAWYLYRTNHPTSSIAPWETMKKQFGLARKLMRVGKFVEHLRAASEFNKKKAMDPVLRFTAVGRQLGYAGYMLFDNATVLDATAIHKFTASQRMVREGYRAWFTGISFSIASSLYQLYRLRERSLKLSANEGAEAEPVVEAKKIERETNQVRLQLISDLCDLTIPASTLGWAKLDDGIVGLAGTVSSLLGVYSQWKKTTPVN